MQKTTVPDRIARVMDDLDLKQSELAKKAGASKSMVNQWISGLIKSIGPQYAFNLQRTTGYSAEWLMTGAGPEHINHPSASKDTAIAALDSAPPAYHAPNPVKSHSEWPFSQSLKVRVQSLSAYQRGIIEGRLRAALDELDNETSNGHTRSANGTLAEPQSCVTAKIITFPGRRTTNDRTY